MFRRRNPAQDEPLADDALSSTNPAPTGDEPPPPAAPATDPAQDSAMSPNKTSGSSFRQPEPRRIVDMPGAARRADTAAGRADTAGPRPADTTRKLQVGREITLAGEISACDHLVVEGQIEAKLRDCHIIEISDSGVFKGAAEVDMADIGGRFDGDLVVRNRLRVRSSGVVAGSVRYGELEVEVGGRLVGTMDPLEAPAPPRAVEPTYGAPPPAAEPATMSAGEEEEAATATAGETVP